MRLALAQIASRSGTPHENLAAHLIAIDAARRERAGVILFPELSLSGYHVEHPAAAADAAPRQLGQIAAHLAGGEIAIVGAPWRRAGGVANSMVVVTHEGVSHRQDKVHLPGYGSFTEARRFAP